MSSPITRGLTNFCVIFPTSRGTATINAVSRKHACHVTYPFRFGACTVSRHVESGNGAHADPPALGDQLEVVARTIRRCGTYHPVIHNVSLHLRSDSESRGFGYARSNAPVRTIAAPTALVTETLVKSGLVSSLNAACVLAAWNGSTGVAQRLGGSRRRTLTYACSSASSLCSRVWRSTLPSKALAIPARGGQRGGPQVPARCGCSNLRCLVGSAWMWGRWMRVESCCGY